MLARFDSYTISDSFFQPYIDALAQKGIEHQWKMCEETGRLENFERAARGETGTYEGSTYNDSDVHKLAEATYYAAATFPDAGFETRLTDYARLINAAIQSDGYLQTCIQVNHPNERYFGLAARHELYCMGHFLEAVCAESESVRSSEIAQAGQNVADHLAQTFGPDKTKGYCGHQELELALARFDDVFDSPQSMELSKWMTDSRGTRPSPFEEELRDPKRRHASRGYELLAFKEGQYNGDYFQDQRPLREETQAVGHSVRVMYQFCGALDAYGSSDKQLNAALQTIWTNLVSKRMYITGGVGSSGSNEGFTFDYDLPNRTAYAETCAAIGLCFWAARMGQTFQDGSYYDVFERSLFNGVLSGMSLEDTTYFYENPLESRGDRVRKPWYTCACCPPNIARFLLSLGRYIWSFDDHSLSLHLLLAGEGTARIGNQDVQVKVTGDYLSGEGQTIRLDLDQETQFDLRIRIPAWCEDFILSMDDKTIDIELKNGYITLTRTWSQGVTEVNLDLPSIPKRFYSNSQVIENLGRVCVMKGPLVYCLEEADFGASVQRFIADPTAKIVCKKDSLELAGWVASSDTTEQLYHSIRKNEIKAEAANLRPYCHWGNRGQSTMQVWHREGVVT